MTSILYRQRATLIALLSLTVAYSAANEGGSFESAVTLEFSSRDARYTLDGSSPTPSSPKLPSSLRLDTTTVLRVLPSGEGRPQTSVYLIGEPATKLPTVCLAIDPQDLFDDERGIYVQGWNGAPARYPGGLDANWNQDWEKPAHVSWIEPNGAVAFNIDVGVEISGNASRALPQKSLHVKTKAKYGSEEGVPLQLFGQNGSVLPLRRFKLRNSGADWYSTLFRDALIHALVKDQVDVDGQASLPVHLYLNENYWGIHQVRESLSEHYLARHYPSVNRKTLDLWKNFRVSKVYEGDASAWLTLQAYLERHTLASNEAAAHVGELLDIPAALDYYIVQLWAANMDWPGSNVRMWRDHDEQSPHRKIRFLLFDLDDGLGFMEAATDPGFDSFAFALADKSQSHPNLPRDTLLFRRLLENSTIRADFHKRLKLQLQTVYAPERVRKFAKTFQDQLEPEIERHLARWGDELAEDGIASIEDWRAETETMLNWCDARPDKLLEHAANHLK